MAMCMPWLAPPQRADDVQCGCWNLPASSGAMHANKLVGRRVRYMLLVSLRVFVQRDVNFRCPTSHTYNNYTFLI